MILVELIKNINSLISAEISVLLGNIFFSPSYLHFLYQFVNKCTIHLKFQPYPKWSFSINDLETHFSVKVNIYFQCESRYSQAELLQLSHQPQNGPRALSTFLFFFLQAEDAFQGHRIFFCPWTYLLLSLSWKLFHQFLVFSLVVWTLLPFINAQLFSS